MCRSDGIYSSCRIVFQIMICRNNSFLQEKKTRTEKHVADIKLQINSAEFPSEYFSIYHQYVPKYVSILPKCVFRTYWTVHIIHVRILYAPAYMYVHYTYQYYMYVRVLYNIRTCNTQWCSIHCMLYIRIGSKCTYRYL